MSLSMPAIQCQISLDIQRDALKPIVPTPKIFHHEDKHDANLITIKVEIYPASIRTLLEIQTSSF